MTGKQTLNNTATPVRKRNFQIELIPIPFPLLFCRPNYIPARLPACQTTNTEAAAVEIMIMMVEGTYFILLLFIPLLLLTIATIKNF